MIILQFNLILIKHLWILEIWTYGASEVRRVYLGKYLKYEEARDKLLSVTKSFEEHE